MADVTGTLGDGALYESVPRVGCATVWGTARRVYEEAPGIWCVDCDLGQGGFWLSQGRREQLPRGWRSLLQEDVRIDRATLRVGEEATLRVWFNLGGAGDDERIQASMDALAATVPHSVLAHNWKLVREYREEENA